MKPSFVIGIATYKRPDDLARCLKPLIPMIKVRSNFRLVVVNDASHDENYQKVVSQYTDCIEYVTREENGGPGLARNSAFAGAKEDFLVCTDDDCIPPENWLDVLQSVVEANPEVDLIAGNVKPVWTGDPSWFERLIAAPIAYPRPHFIDGSLLTAVTANSAMRRETFKRVGGFNSDLRGATEDHNITQAIIQTGGSYLAPEYWMTGHRAEDSLKNMRKRFHWYGKGCAQSVLKEDSWKLAEVSSDGTIWGCTKMVLKKTALAWKNPENRSKGFVKRVAFTLVNCMCGVEYERGWRQGLKEISRTWPADLPGEPTLDERYTDFGDSVLQVQASGKTVS